MTMKHQILSLVVVTALLPGCVTYLIEDDVKAERKESERTHYFTAYKGQATRMAEAGSCIKAAEHFEKKFVPHEESSFGGRTAGSNSTPFKDDDLKALDERIKAEARILVDTCLAKEAPALQAARRFERLAELFRRLALLPIPEAEQQALVLRADTTDLLRADAAVEDAEKAWAAGKVYDALSGFWSAKNIASSVKAATDAQKAKYATLLAEKERAHVDDMLKKAGEAGKDPATAHLAALYLARALEVSKDKAIGRRLEATRQELLASHVYQWQVEWKGEPRITKAAKDTLLTHRFSGNLKAAGPREFSAVIDVGAFTVTPSEKEGSRTGEYKTGSKSVDNPEYRDLQAFIIKQQGCLARLSPSVFASRPGCSGACGSSSADRDRHQREAGCAYNCSSYECSKRGNEDKLKDAQRKLKNTPMVLNEDVMSPWTYPTREWSQVLKAPVQLTLKHALENAPSSSTMSLQHEYTDHAHGIVSQLGKGKKEITKQSDGELADAAGRKLGSQVIAEIEKDYQAWFAATPKQGDRGAVLFVLLGGDARGYDAQLEKATGVRNAHQILLAR
jgi:hypothetical protein